MEDEDTISALMSAVLDGRTPLSVATTPLAAPGVAPAGAQPVRPPMG